MFPRNQYKDTVTIYTPFADNMTGLVRYYRRALKRCFWNSDSVSVQRTGGTAAPEQIDLNIPLSFNPGYTARADWMNTPKNELENVWTLRIGTASEWTIILKGDTVLPQFEVWRDSADMDRQLSSLRRELGAAEHKPANVSAILFGAPSMHRITCSC